MKNNKIKNDLKNILEYYEADLLPRLRFQEDINYLKEQIAIIKKELENGEKQFLLKWNKNNDIS